MKKLLYILAMVTMFSLNANADSYWYLHFNYPNGDEEEIHAVIWVDEDAKEGKYYTDETMTESHYFIRDFQFPTCEGYKFYGFYDRQEGICALIKLTKYCDIKSYYITKRKDFHLYGFWEKVSDDTTAINEVESTSSNKDIYTLNGVKVKEVTKPGLYIINGKKVMVR